MPSTHTLLLIADLIGTFVFALSGATAATRRRLDLFGVLVRMAALKAEREKNIQSRSRASHFQ